MRTKGTKYETISKLPSKAKPVSLFARENDWQVATVYLKHDRHFEGYANGNKGPYPGYVIRQFQGMNYVIPD
jgi:hypothetical protein